MGRETYFPHLAILVPERQSCACLRGQYTLRKITGTQISTQINVPRLNLHKRPRHHRCPTSRDFVPWRFSDAGRRSAWIASSCRHPKTYTLTDMGRPSSITSLARPMAPLSSDESVFALHASADLPYLHSAPLGSAINCQI